MKTFVTFLSLVIITCSARASSDETLIVDGDNIKISFSRMDLNTVAMFWTEGKPSKDLNKHIEAVSKGSDFSQCKITGWMPEGYIEGPAIITRSADGLKQLRIPLLSKGDTKDYGNTYASCQSTKEFSVKILGNIFGPNVDIKVESK